MPKLSEFLFGKKEKTQQMPLFSPEQQAFMDMLLQGTKPGVQSGMEYLSQLLSGDEKEMDIFEAPLRRQYEEQTIPSLAERFASLDAQDSSAFGQALGQAGAGLTENLAALRQGLKMQALQQLQGLFTPGLGQRQENILRPGTSGFLGGVAQGAGQGLGQAAAMLPFML